MAIYVRCLHSFRIFAFHIEKPCLNKQRFSQYLLSRKIKLNINIESPKENSFHTSVKLDKRRKTAEERKSQKLIEYSPKSKADIINVWRNITVKELAEILNRNTSYVEDILLNKVMGKDTMISDIKMLEGAIRRSGHRMRIIGKPTNSEEVEEKDVYPRPPPDKSILKPCPPVVAVMGHVDHGKTTLLDALRHSNVVKQEFGGITQHIGAFSVTLNSGAKITFLDTPGHAAFSSMRQRGANITNIVVLVVAADDGVMEQTLESIRMARQANVSILVAINKIDAPNADVEMTKNMLVQHGIQVESMGGDVQAIPISALKHINLDQLTEALILQAELLEIGADPTGPVEAVVVDSKIHPHRGKICTVIVQRGTLKKGSVLIADTAVAKVRGLRDANGHFLQSVSPGYPAEIEGWKDIPSAGEIILEVTSEKEARAIVKYRESKKLKVKQEEDALVIASKEEQHLREYKERLQLKRRMGRFKMRRDGPRKPEIEKKDDVPTLNIIIKGDVDGTLEAILNTLDTYQSSDCHMDLIHYGIGAITENDIELANTFNSIIYAFNVNCPEHILKQAEENNVVIKHHNVIYKLVDDVKDEINAKLPLKDVEEIIGEASVLQEFAINKGKQKIPVAGCRCVKGHLKRTSLYRLTRNNEVLYEGPLSSMRHLKEEVDVIKKDIECGLQLTNKDIDYKPGDIIVCYEKKMLPQKTNWDPGF